MNPSMNALDLIRQSLHRYIDTPAENILPQTALLDIGVDSLTLVEMLFELEDKLGQRMPEPPATPQTIGDVMALIEPYLSEKPQSAT
jgi:acyl carrier protein